MYIDVVFVICLCDLVRCCVMLLVCYVCDCFCRDFFVLFVFVVVCVPPTVYMYVLWLIVCVFVCFGVCCLFAVCG